MAKNCPGCGAAVEDEPKFCPACGAPLAEPEPAAQQNHPESVQPDQPLPQENPLHTRLQETREEKRVFVLREQKYGDTVHFEDQADSKQNAEAFSSARTNMSLYLSVFSFVLSVIAIALVIIFAVVPTEKRSDGETAVNAPPATAAPTQEPTEPPIAGNYALSEIRGEGMPLQMLVFRSSRLEMHPDYTGSLTAGGIAVGELTLDKETNTGVLMHADCTYSFDGRVLVLDDGSFTLVYKKETQ